MMSINDNGWNEREDRFNDDEETNLGSVNRNTGNDDDLDEDDTDLATDDDIEDTDYEELDNEEDDDEYAEDTLSSDYINDQDDNTEVERPHETNVERQDQGSDASFSEQTDVTPPEQHGFPSVGNAKTDFASRNQGRTTGRMVGHEPGTEGI